MDSPHDLDPIGLRPGGRVEGCWSPPGSKSLAQRALLCSALADGSTTLVGFSPGGDVRAALELIEECGVGVERVAVGGVRIAGRAPGEGSGLAPGEPVHVGESGTLARLTTAALAFCGRGVELVEVRAGGSLSRRSSPALFRCLEQAGVRLEHPPTRHMRPDGWPVRFSPKPPPNRLSIENPSSSQEVSALLIAQAAYPGPRRVVVHGAIPSRPYVDMTLGVLADFGVEVVGELQPQGECLQVRGPLAAPLEPVQIEPDASAGAVALAAACLSGGRLEIEGLDEDSLQGDVRIVEHLRSFGCRATSVPGRLIAAGWPTHGARINLAEEPDLAPVLAAVGACVARAVGQGRLSGSGLTRLDGLGTLPGKESSRIAVLARGLEALGLKVEAGTDYLEIRPGSATPLAGSGCLIDPHGDHRMAFAFALMGLVVEGVQVADPGCVAKSWPGFWSDMSELGASTSRPPERGQGTLRAP